MTDDASHAAQDTVASNHLRRRLLGMADRANESSVSRESIQTFARWLCFPRKPSVLQSMAAAFAAVVSSEKSVEKRLELYLKVLQETFLPTANDGGAAGGGDVARQKQKSAAVRSALGDVALMALAEAVAACGSETAIANSLLQCANQWDEASVFATPTIVSEVRRIVKSKPKPTEPIKDEQNVDDNDEADETTMTNTTATPTVSLTPPDAKEEPESDTIQETRDNVGIKEQEQERSVKQESAETTSTREDPKAEVKVEQETQDDDGYALFEDTEEQERIAEAMMMEEGGADEGAEEDGGGPKPGKDKEKEDLDFEMEPGQAPAGPINNMSELLVPCRAIATLQITREIANDRALQAASTISSVPQEVQDACETALKAYEQAKEDKAATAMDDDDDDDDEELLQKVKPDLDWDKIKLPDEVLDLDVDEALSNVRLLRDFVTKQRDARTICLDLLRKSHCNFGSQQAAHSFAQIANQLAQVKQRRIILEDAMELEGMDMIDDPLQDATEDDETLEPFSWYEPPAAAATTTTTTTTTAKSEDAGATSDGEE